uniref:Reverse transcriptase domain-containing protein n=1 Tax=Nicotiana tabacum TaxID=4097 RepID=A0A1S4BLM7_TOBAC|nr:PREDICTED: uncharacterized protein LOC107809615 [Nicotiana tabacum]
MVLQEYGLPNKMVRWIMECVTNVNYSILINGGLTKRFQARKGLRQGDSMSPYMFVLVMEYLSRTLKTLKDIPEFNFHPRCAKLNLTYIYFADDLIMCCTADKIFIQLLLDKFNHFSKVTELMANLEKSSIYVAGVTQDFKDMISTDYQFKLEALPFKYLGVPLSSRKLSIQQTYWGQLIKNVLFEMQTYWGQKGAIQYSEDVHLIETSVSKGSLESLILGTTIPRHNFILWLALHHRLVTVDRLTAWGIQVDMGCVLCSSGKAETMTHLFFECQYSRNMWSTLLNWMGERHQIGAWEDEVLWLIKRTKNGRPHNSILAFLFAAVIYHTWIERNMRRFQGKQTDTKKIYVTLSFNCISKDNRG